MDKFYNDRLKVFSSNKYIKIKKTNNKLSVYVPKLKSYKGMLRFFFIYTLKILLILNSLILKL